MRIAEAEAKQRIRKAISNLLWGFPGAGGGRAEKIGAYVEALDRIAPSFVEEACRAAGRGKIGNPAFLPSAGQLCQWAEELQAQALKEKYVDRRPWVAVPYPPREPVALDPSAKTFSPYKLGLTQQQIRYCVIAYRRGEDWMTFYRQSLKANERVGLQF